jgi:RNA polymerase sigma-70 factor (ECF subfamily)
MKVSIDLRVFNWLLSVDIKKSRVAEYEKAAYHAWSRYKLYNKYYKAMALLAFRIVGKEQVAEDVAQEVITKLWQQRVELQDEAKVRAWLYTSVRNLSIDRLRRTHLSTVSMGDVHMEHHEYKLGENSEEPFFTEEVYRQLFEAINELPPQQRQIFLHNIEGKRIKDIAEIMGISVNTVKTQRQRGIKTLREKLTPNAWMLFVSII